MAPFRQAATRERILSRAGALFARQGLDGLGIRQLAREAKVNIAAVNYHFGSKQALFREVCLLHLRAINAERVALLDALEARRGRVAAAEILAAHLGPVVRFARGGDPANLLFMRLVMAQIARRDPALQSALAAEGKPVLDRVLGLLARALPRASTADLRLGLAQIIGSTTHLLMNEELERAARAARPLSAEALLGRLVAHGVAGLRALRA
ncbi:MAG: TetR/AcrR family transcriptional regulator [Opitutia bacterium]